MKTNFNPVALAAPGFNLVIPAQAGIQLAVDLQRKVNMAPRIRWGGGLVVCPPNEPY